MNRRGFLHGLFGGVAAGGVIVTASDEEIARFSRELAAYNPVVVDPTPPAPLPANGEHLYNGRGELVAVVRDLRMSPDGVDITAACVGVIHIPGFTLNGAPRR